MPRVHEYTLGDALCTINCIFCIQTIFEATPCDGSEMMNQTNYQFNYSTTLHTKSTTRTITGTVNTTFKTATAHNDNEQLHVTFTIMCSEEYYGVLCHSHCKEQDNNEYGHYMCDHSGNKVCQEGYIDSSTNCTISEKHCGTLYYSTELHAYVTEF